MLGKLRAFLFGGEVEQQVVVVNAATLQDAYEFRRRLYADVGDEVPTRIQVEEAMEDGEARICVFVSGGLFRDPFAKVFSAELEPAKAHGASLGGYPALATEGGYCPSDR